MPREIRIANRFSEGVLRTTVSPERAPNLTYALTANSGEEGANFRLVPPDSVPLSPAVLFPSLPFTERDDMRHVVPAMPGVQRHKRVDAHDPPLRMPHRAGKLQCIH